MKEKFRITIFLLTAFIFLHTTAKITYAYGDMFIKVGLEAYKNTSSLTLGNTAINAYFLLDGDFIDYGRIEASSQMSIVTDDLYYVDTGCSFNDYDSAYSEALSAGMNAVAVLLERGNWGVYIGGFNSADSAKAYGGNIVYPNDKRVKLQAGNSVLALFENDSFPIYFNDHRLETFKIGTAEYRGFLNPMRKGSGITAINMVNFEDYLASTISSEMPSAWHIEALKAQAVASRSYAYTRIGIHSDNGYELCDTTHCQLYKGVSAETENSIEAVWHTKGIGAFYDGEVINATFHSSSGGATDDSENVWTNKIGYLRGVYDIYDTEGKSWTRSFTLSELTSLATANGFNIGNVTSVSITSTSATGRVQKLSINGTSGVKVLEKEEIRTFFFGSSGGSLESRNFQIGDKFVQSASGVQPSLAGEINVLHSSGTVTRSISAVTVLDSVGYEKSGMFFMNVITKDGVFKIENTPAQTVANSNAVTTSSGNTVVFSGRGWGHGVGLSQFGAKGMAEAGYTFDEILKFYYRGIELLQVAD